MALAGCCQHWHGLNVGMSRGEEKNKGVPVNQAADNIFPNFPSCPWPNAWVRLAGGMNPVAFSTLFHSRGPGSCSLPTVWKYYIVQFNVCVLKTMLEDSSVYKAYII